MRVLAIVVAAVLALPTSLAAQDTPVADLFPSAARIGLAWNSAGAADAALTEYPMLERFAGSAYWGPNGARVLIGYLRVAEGPAATRDAWELASATVDDYRRTFVVDYTAEATLAGAPPVAGCAEMRRSEGTDPVFTFLPVGVSLCAADPDVIVVAYVSGKVGNLMGSAASDRIVELVLAE